ncbi:(d)CMP kinase [Acidaminococcus sp.]|uniref:(d)CMP kinase n=1 Tax=Acidaminococcus sp. TaxID=1872103 RepID=UPI003D7C6C62
MKKIIIAIDGPAGAGKSTIAKKVAARLGYAYIDTGAMYRTVTLCFLESSQPFSEEAVTRIANRIDIAFQYRDGVNRVFVDGREVTDEIRSLEVSQNVSKVAAVGGVRTAMVAAQRKIGERGGVVMDGRDIGTVVFPRAQLKVFLTASVEERARRRYLELKEKGVPVDLADLEKRIAQRDALDENREISPLRCAEDAHYLDSTALSIDEVTEQIARMAGKVL